MASLTPLSKGLIGLAVVGAMASAVWHLGLKERFSGTQVAEPPASSVSGASVPAVTAPPAPPASSTETSTGPAVKAPEQVVPPIPPSPPSPSIPSVAAERKAPAPGLSPAENAEAGRKLLESKNYDEARIYLERAVQGGDGSAACHLGEMNLNGQGGLPVNRDKAANLFQLAQSRNTICFAAAR